MEGCKGNLRITHLPGVCNLQMPCHPLDLREESGARTT